MGAVEIGGCGDESPRLDTALAWIGIEANKVQGDVLQNREIVCGMAGADAHLVIGEDDVQATVQAVLDAPVRPDCLRQASGVRRQATQVEAPIDACLAVDAAL